MSSTTEGQHPRQSRQRLCRLFWAIQRWIPLTDHGLEPLVWKQHSRLMWALELWNPSLWGLPAPGIGVCQHTECTVVILQGRNALGTFSSPERPKSLLNFQCAPIQQTVIKMWKKGNCHQSISMNYSRNIKYHWHRMIMVRFGSVNILGFRWPRWTFAQPC